MRAMRLHHLGEPLQLDNVDEPIPGNNEVLLKVTACGVCRTDLHIVDGELPAHRLPLIPGHEIVGRVVALGAGVSTLQPGDKVGVPWLGHSCGVF
jgi:propanol-preferring alcohol dehydrogenase